MVQADPMAAEAWYKEHKDLFTGAARVKAEEALERETKAFKIQATVDALSRKFGPGSESEGLAWIRKNYRGEDENAVAAAFKVRMAEVDADRAYREAQLHKWQNDNFAALYKEYWANGINPPSEMLNKLLDENRISIGHHQYGVSRIRDSGSRAGTERLLQKRMGAEKWAALSPEEQERAVMRERGITEEQRARLLPALTAGVIYGDLSNADIDKLYGKSEITASERAWYRGLGRKFSDEQKGFMKRRRAEIRNDIGKIVGLGGKGAPDITRDAEALFDEKTADLEEKSKTFREDLLKAKKEALVEAIENSGRNFESGATGKRRNHILGAIDKAIEEAEEYRPEVYNSLSGEKKPVGEAEKDRDKEIIEGKLSGRVPNLLGAGIAAETR
jgi:hypothetical protein